MRGPLDDIRILAVSQFGAGPFGMMQLADLGADVIKIEDPVSRGDIGRWVQPGAQDGDSLYYQSFNRNTRSVTLNLREPEGRELFRALAAKSDAVFNNLRGDQPEALGLTYDALKECNPALVCVSLSGFGRTGARAAEPGYDYLIQACSGFMSMTGHPDGPPERAGVSIVDYAGGLAAALGLVTGIHQARRTGVGCDLDIALLDTAIALLNYLAAWTLNSDFRPVRMPSSSHPTLYPSQVFPTNDGHLVVMCAKEKFWVNLVTAMDLPHLAEDPRFRTFADRFQHRDEMERVLTERFRQESTDVWLERLRGSVPVARVNSVEEALSDEQVIDRGMIVDVPHPLFGMLRETASAVRFPDVAGSHRPGSALGADTDDVLRSILGLDKARIDSLRASGAI
ncbi:MAG: CoA transferase [Thermomicrobiales bacterium]|nr:CoA transferase [Thermomicrobiales bacterium]